MKAKRRAVKIKNRQMCVKCLVRGNGYALNSLVCLGFTLYILKKVGASVLRDSLWFLCAEIVFIYENLLTKSSDQSISHTITFRWQLFIFVKFLFRSTVHSHNFAYRLQNALINYRTLWTVLTESQQRSNVGETTISRRV